MRQVALITGSAGGIGLGIARELALRGFDLAINDIREEQEVRQVLKDLSDRTGRVVYCRGDISLKEQRESILEQVKGAFGKLNVLVNNAGIPPAVRADILETSEESFDRVLAVNLKGAFFLSQSVAGWLIRQKSEDREFKGCIINITSISADYASVNRGEYCISKAGGSMMSRLFAVRLGEFDIPVYEVRPGVTKTSMTEGVREKYDRMIAEGLTLQKRWGMPEDVGKTVGALATGQLPYSTGSVIMVDGGFSTLRF